MRGVRRNFAGEGDRLHFGVPQKGVLLAEVGVAGKKGRDILDLVTYFHSG